MIDLHSHLLPGIDDGAPDLDVSLAMARAFVADGVTVVACTPHILPGLYPNTGADIRQRVEWLQNQLEAHAIPLRVVAGADNHMVPDFIGGLRSGHLLPLHDSRYVLVEPPHHNAPPRIEEFFFELMAHGYVPVLTHPERLSWINQRYSAIARLADAGVWMQITAGSVLGKFGRSARHWAERMLDEGRAHIFASDAHDLTKRPPNLSEALQAVASRVGPVEAENLFFVRPRGMLLNVPASDLPAPERRISANTTQAEPQPVGRRRGIWRIFQ